MINFIRGVDTYDQDADNNKTESIHKLADIYHSNLVLVGAPEGSITSFSNANFDKTDTAYRINNNYQTFKNNNKNREELIYAGANNGILHAFKTSDGEELWALYLQFYMKILRNSFQ